MNGSAKLSLARQIVMKVPRKSVHFAESVFVSPSEKSSSNVREFSSLRERPAQVEAADLGIPEDLFMSAFQPHLTALHHDPLGGDAKAGAHILFDQQNGPAGAVHQFDGLEDLLQGHRVEAHRGLIQQDQRRLEHQGTGKLDQALLPARQVGGLFLGALLDHREKLFHFAQPFVPRARGRSG